MVLENFKSVVFDKIVSLDEDKITYEKVFVYDEVKEKLKKVLNVIPKNQIRGYLTIYAFDKKMNLSGQIELNKLMTLDAVRNDYKKFVGNFSKPFYIYHIETVNEDLRKKYDAVFILIPKKSKYSSIYKLLEKTSMPPAIKSDINDFLEKKLKELNLS